MKTLIKGGRIITACEEFFGDILIHDEKIVSIGSHLREDEGVNLIDAAGKLLMPGGVDAHVHLDLPMFDTVSSDDHYSGHKAAAFGGTTTVMDFVSFDKETLRQSVDAWHKKADEKAAIDFAFHMNLSRFDEAVAQEIPQLRKIGINSLKVFTAYTNRLRLNDGDIFRAMRIAKDHQMLVMVHAENGDVIDTLVEEALTAGHISPEWHARTRPAEGAEEAVYRAIKLAEMAHTPVYIVHMNSKGGVEHVHQARQRGLPVMGETCPQYLFFTDDTLKREDGAKWICSPPVRSEKHLDGVWQAVKNGTLQVIATDHCPFFYDGSKPIEYEGQMVAIPGKELGANDFTKIPNGLPGVGDRMMVLWTKGVRSGLITANQFVALTSANPAKIFGIYPKKGALLPGSDADIVIWDPEKEITFGVRHSKQRTDYNLYEGWHLKGVVEKVFLRGKMLVDGEQWLGAKGEGRFIHCGDMTAL